MARTASKDERLHLRVDAAAKRKLLDASAIEHQSISDFVMAQALPAAERILENQHITLLGPRDWDAFYEALTKPPRPTEALRKGFKEYRRQADG